MVLINDLIRFDLKFIESDQIVFDKKVQSFCCFPYKNHKQCPNFNKSDNCPPKSPYLEKEIKSFKFHILLYCTFDFTKYLIKFMEEKPEWKEKPDLLRSVLYWQSQVKRLFNEEIDKLCKKYSIDFSNINQYSLLTCGSGIGRYNEREKKTQRFYSLESVGIHVYQTYQNLKIDFEEKPESKIVMCCLISSKRDFNLGGLRAWVKIK